MKAFQPLSFEVSFENLFKIPFFSVSIRNANNTGKYWNPYKENKFEEEKVRKVDKAINLIYLYGSNTCN